MGSDIAPIRAEWLNVRRIDIIIVSLIVPVESHSSMFKGPDMTISAGIFNNGVKKRGVDATYLFFAPFSTPAVMLKGNGVTGYCSEAWVLSLE